MTPTELGLAGGRLRPAVLTVDLHRGHLDPHVATMALPGDAAARVSAANVAFLDGLRARQVPVIHAVTRYRNTEEIAMNPFWRSVADTDASRRNVMRHNLEGMPGLELMPGVLDPEHDRVIDTKKRYDCFVATDLEFVLRTLGTNLLLITGVNTNSCVLATTLAASVRDFASVVVSDCVDTVDGQRLHEAALACIGQAFARVADSTEVLAFIDSYAREDVPG